MVDRSKLEPQTSVTDMEPRIESLPPSDSEKDDMKVSEEEASKQLFGSSYAMPDIGVDSSDVLGLQAGEPVSIEATDAKPGTYPQYGKLVGLNKNKFVIELENGLRMHFPKVGSFIKKAEKPMNGLKLN